MIDKPYEVSIAKITSETELQKLHDACHELADRAEIEVTPLRVQYADLVRKLEHLEHILTSARNKERIIKDKLDATKALTTLAFKCWYQAKKSTYDNDEVFFYPQRKNAANRIIGIRVAMSVLSDWDRAIYKRNGYHGTNVWSAYQTTMSGADCEKLDRLKQTILTGRNTIADLEEMRKRLVKGEEFCVTFGIADGKVITLQR